MKSLLVACLCAHFAQSLHIKSQDDGIPSNGPRYAKLGAEKDIEFVWQRPSGQVKGILFMAHGSEHHSTDFFESGSLPDQKCEHSLKGRCLGLPEEVVMRRIALERNYLVVAATGGQKGEKGNGWHPHDLAKVKHGLDHIRKEEKLADVPLFAVGASSGGKFVGYLAKSDVRGLTCISPQISEIPSSDFPKDVSVFFQHMPLDSKVANAVNRNLKELRAQHVRMGEQKVRSQPVTQEFLERQGVGLSHEAAEELLVTFRLREIINSTGFLEKDPRNGDFGARIMNAVKHTNKGIAYEADESALSELLNVAWAKHELTSQYTGMMLDFCENKDDSLNLYEFNHANLKNRQKEAALLKSKQEKEALLKNKQKEAALSKTK